MSEQVFGEYIIRLVCCERDGDVVPVRATLKTKPIVRCKDCRNYEPRGDAKLVCRFTHPSMPNTVEWCYAEPDGYCAWGERR